MDQKFTELVALLSTQPAGLPLPRTASGLSLDIVNLTCSRGIARLLRSRGAQRRQRQVEAAYALSAMAAPSSPLSLWDAVDPSRGRAVRVHHVDSATAPVRVKTIIVLSGDHAGDPWPGQSLSRLRLSLGDCSAIAQAHFFSLAGNAGESDALHSPGLDGSLGRDRLSINPKPALHPTAISWRGTLPTRPDRVPSRTSLPRHATRRLSFGRRSGYADRRS